MTEEPVWENATEIENEAVKIKEAGTADKEKTVLEVKKNLLQLRLRRNMLLII